MEDNNKPLRRGEAMWVVDWLVDIMHKAPPKGGFYSVLRKTPTEVAKEYNVPVTELLKVARRVVAIFLAVLLISGMMIVPVLADDGPPPYDPFNVPPGASTEVTPPQPTPEGYTIAPEFMAAQGAIPNYEAEEEPHPEGLTHANVLPVAEPTPFPQSSSGPPHSHWR